MTDEPKPDPIEGFQVVDYDEETETLTIAVSDALFGHARTNQAMQTKAVEIMCGGPKVKKVVFVPRSAEIK